MSKMLRNRLTRLLVDHARRHRLKLLAYENVTATTLGEARALMCEAARRLAIEYKPRTARVDLAESSQGVVIVVTSLREIEPKLCPACKAAQDEGEVWATWPPPGESRQ